MCVWLYERPSFGRAHRRGATPDGKAMKSHSPHDHDLGLQHDLNVMLGRRKAIGWLASAGGVMLLSACSSGSDTSSSDASSSSSTDTGSNSGSSSGSGSGSSSSGTCVADPTETAGPYPADGSNSANGSIANVLDDVGIVRTDMRPSFGAYSGTADGVQLDITITLVDVSNSCSPLEGYAIYLWHCDAEGDYSIYDLPNENYLRAVGVTDANGQVTFTTIFPGCYNGRYPHMHFEVYESLSAATSYQNKLLTGQMAMPENECTSVYNSSSTYDQSLSNFSGESISGDNIFGDNTSAQIAQQIPTLDGDPYSGYTGDVLVGIAL